ncbi:MAG: murein biosynthesis integral membrane protein MurJ [Hyphomicrobiales bacterium]|nr:murein biosynthesis integral membrane protein MurJ [Hyphomicrobiales bacterium]
MIGRIFTVGGFTLLSRITGFLRDIVLAAILGAGPVADAFFVALRLPNHFRAIFAEGAFNAAFVPAYARIRQQAGPDPAALFADRVFTLLFVVQLVLLVAALAFTPTVIAVLAPGFSQDPERFALAVELTRITFPYLLLISLVTLYGGILNALGRFASAAAAPILLNLSMITAMALAFAFPSAGHAAAWGVFVAGCLEVLLLLVDVRRQGALPAFRWPQFDVEIRLFLKRFGPATIGSAETQIALFADTIIASLLAAGALSALYYADRLNQLPIGVIGIAVGTVLLPEMANRLAQGDEAGARRSQNRAIEFTLLLCMPCLVVFLLLPELIMQALFARGAFTAADAAAAGATLRAYAIGLLPFVLMRSAAATFLSRGDTWTPVKALFVAVLVNVALKVLLYESHAQVGLAFATAIGGWVNLTLLTLFAQRAGLFVFEAALVRSALRLAIAALALALALWLSAGPVQSLLAGRALQHELALALLALIGGLVYGATVVAMFGGRWLAELAARPRPPQPPAPA